MVSGGIPGNAATWTLVKNEFNRKMEKHLTVPQIKSRYYMLRSRYKEILRFMSSGGFIWDTDEKKILVDNERAWDAYVKKNPDEACYKTLSCPIFEDLCVLFGHVPAENIDVETPNMPSKKQRSSGFHGEVEAAANNNSGFDDATTGKYVSTTDQQNDPYSIPSICMANRVEKEKVMVILRYLLASQGRTKITTSR
ncbi:hypothetical protein MKW94_026286 [Papaver nudicaule]|uniref:Myb/SANT-like domain-containing protein n=1 Tax=Papaver nudicaule TaxID=74823 RepID=A0AA41SFT1_PAPNU|nr:hypothetical protein [Papaver nudicaule]